MQERVFRTPGCGGEQLSCAAPACMHAFPHASTVASLAPPLAAQPHNCSTLMYLPNTGPPPAPPAAAGILPGDFMLQNLCSLVAAHVLGAQPGSRVLDMCAAPGGKTTAIAQLMGNQGEVGGAATACRWPQLRTDGCCAALRCAALCLSSGVVSQCVRSFIAGHPSQPCPAFTFIPHTLSRSAGHRL